MFSESCDCVTGVWLSACRLPPGSKGDCFRTTGHGSAHDNSIKPHIIQFAREDSLIARNRGTQRRIANKIGNNDKIESGTISQRTSSEDLKRLLIANCAASDAGNRTSTAQTEKAGNGPFVRASASSAIIRIQSPIVIRMPKLCDSDRPKGSLRCISTRFAN